MLVVFVLIGSGAAFYYFYVLPIRDAVGQATGQIVPRAPAASGQPAASLGASDARPVAVPTVPSLSGTARINVLLLGSDTDPKFKGDYNTQIMIVVSIDPVQKTVSMLSIPRDFWVPVPGLGTTKIGLAYGAGSVALARETVEKDFGIPIHYYAWIGLDGFIKVIDTLGGVNVDVSHPIVDDAYPDDVNSPDPYAYRRLYIPAGPQHLDGLSALQYVRSRHGDLIGDFGRSQRQQQVLDAVRNETSGKDLVPKLPNIATDLADYLRTDMTVSQIAQFAGFADQLRGKPISQHTLGPPTYSQDGTSADGQSIVIPNWPATRALVDSIFGLNTARTMSNPRIDLGIAPAPASGTQTVRESPIASASRAGSATATVRPTASQSPTAQRTPLAPAPTPTSLRIRTGEPVATPRNGLTG